MKSAIIGGDRRQVEAALFLMQKGYNVSLFGTAPTALATSSKLKEAMLGADIVILPHFCTRDGVNVFAPFANNEIALESILAAKPKIFFGGRISDKLKAELSKMNIRFYDYTESESVAYKNAVLTAEAALGIAALNYGGSIIGSKALVIGYGRIGKCLSEYLKSLGSSVTATSRSDKTLSLIKADGFTPLHTEKCKASAFEFDLIFNTAPFPVLDREFFEKCRRYVFIEDLATNSGIDLKAAEQLRINAAVYGGLPGKYSPAAAGKIIAEEILGFLKRGETDE